MSSIQVSPSTPVEAYGAFSGAIDQNSLHRIFNAFGAVTNPKLGFKHVHLLFQSSGGVVSDGICLYNYFSGLPVELTLYNVGSVDSIAAIAYLGATHRKVSAVATFLLHKTTSNLSGANARAVQDIAETILTDDQRTEFILRRHLRWPDERWSSLEGGSVVIQAEDAVCFGIADEIADFSPPRGVQVFTV